MTRNRSSQRNSNVSSPSRSQRKIPIPSIPRQRSDLPCILSPPTIPVSVNALSQCASPPCKLNQTLNTQIVKSQQSLPPFRSCRFKHYRQKNNPIYSRESIYINILSESQRIHLNYYGCRVGVGSCHQLSGAVADEYVICHRRDRV